MRAPLTTDRQKSLYLLSLVCEDLPTNAVDALVRGGHPGTAAHLVNVRLGRKTNLCWLVDLIEAGLPDFTIPPAARPAHTNAPLFHE